MGGLVPLLVFAQADPTEDWILNSEPTELVSEYAERRRLWAAGFGAPVIPAPGFWSQLMGALGQAVGGNAGGVIGGALGGLFHG